MGYQVHDRRRRQPWIQYDWKSEAPIPQTVVSFPSTEPQELTHLCIRLRPVTTGLCIMSISLDISNTPGDVSATGGDSLTTATFTPPLLGSSLLVVCAAATFTTNNAFSVSDSAGNSYISGPSFNGGGFFGAGASFAMFQCYLMSSPGAMTVSMSYSETAVNDIWLKVLVLNGANSNQTGTAQGHSHSGPGGTTSSEVTLTPNPSGSSWIVACTSVGGGQSPPSRVSNFTDISWLENSGNGSFGTGANGTGPTGSTKVGWFGMATLPNATGAWEIFAA
jgi:hypothetical protein